MPPEPDRELDRQFRVLGQTLSMHSVLRGRYAWRAGAIDIVLLACSVVFCATTFVDSSVLASIGLAANRLRIILGIASTLAFFASLVALRVDWKGRSVRHAETVKDMSRALALFRDLREDDGTWPSRRRAELQRAYWDAMNNNEQVPASQFLSLKARHLRKITISKWLDKNPGCPVLVMKAILMCRSIRKAWGKPLEVPEEPKDATKGQELGQDKMPDSRLPDGKGDRSR